MWSGWKHSALPSGHFHLVCSIFYSSALILYRPPKSSIQIDFFTNGSSCIQPMKVKVLFSLLVLILWDKWLYRNQTFLRNLFLKLFVLLKIQAEIHIQSTKYICRVKQNMLLCVYIITSVFILSLCSMAVN